MKTFIEINIKKIKEEVFKINAYKCLVVKSNFYGFGYSAISYLKGYFNCIIVATVEEMKKVKKYNPHIDTEYIVLYENMINVDFEIEDSVYIVVMNKQQLFYVNDNRLDKSKFYIRGNSFLGAHGLPWGICKEQLSGFKGYIIHINEYLNEEEKEELIEIDKVLAEKEVVLNIGGSIASENLSMLTSKVQFRFAKNILFDNSYDKSTFIVHLQVMNIVKGENLEIGYKSDKKVINRGWIYLLSIGYGDWSLITRMYEKKVLIPYEGGYFSIPVYPCMNTCWFYSDTKFNYTESKIVLFEERNSIKYICDSLDIDEDEFYTSFSENIERVYRD